MQETWPPFGPDVEFPDGSKDDIFLSWRGSMSEEANCRKFVGPESRLELRRARNGWIVSYLEDDEHGHPDRKEFVFPENMLDRVLRKIEEWAKG